MSRARAAAGKSTRSAAALKACRPASRSHTLARRCRADPSLPSGANLRKLACGDWINRGGLHCFGSRSLSSEVARRTEQPPAPASTDALGVWRLCCARDHRFCGVKHLRRERTGKRQWFSSAILRLRCCVLGHSPYVARRIRHQGLLGQLVEQSGVLRVDPDVRELDNNLPLGGGPILTAFYRYNNSMLMP